MEQVVALGDGPLTPGQIAEKLQVSAEETEARPASAHPRHVVNQEIKDGVPTCTPATFYHRLDPLSPHDTKCLSENLTERPEPVERCDLAQAPVILRRAQNDLSGSSRIDSKVKCWPIRVKL